MSYEDQYRDLYIEQAEVNQFAVTLYREYPEKWEQNKHIFKTRQERFRVRLRQLETRMYAESNL